jgi:hypothetical protein
MKDKLLIAVLFAVVLAALTSTAAASTTWYVNGLSGSNSNDCKFITTACKTIGHAISLAAAGDSVMIAAAVYNEHLRISQSLKLIGVGSTSTIVDGSGTARVVTILSSMAHVSLQKLTIRNGLITAGTANAAGIYNLGILTISNCLISGNHTHGTTVSLGGGIYNNGTLTMNGSTITGNTTSGLSSGGGIYNSGTLTINTTTISQHNAGSGGGIYSNGVLTINRSILFANTAVTGGAVYSLGTGAINNSTISGNTASAGGGIDNAGVLRISNSTLNANQAIHNCSLCGQGGNLYNTGGATVTVQNSIVSNSVSGGNCSGTITSNGYNLSSDATCNFADPGDLNNADPMLGALGYHGGPTQTIPLLSGSPAIDAGNPNGCTDNLGHLLKTDQRGKPRPDTEDIGGCDTGAYERQSD